MGLGGTAKKLQKVMDAAEQLYSKMNEIIGELKDLQSEVERTSQQVDRMERDLAEQRALLEALADEWNLDVDEVVAKADIPDDITAGDGDAAGSGSGDEPTDVDVAEEDGA